MNFATFETISEFEEAKNFLMQNLNLIPDWVHIGGMAKTLRSTTDWYWIKNDRKINFAIPFGPFQPDFHGNSEWCLSLGAKVQQVMLFNDIDCYSQQTFLCDELDDKK